MEAAVRCALIEFLRKATGNGLFPLVAYGPPSDVPFMLLTTNIKDLPRAISALKEATRGEYNLGRYIPAARLSHAVEHNPHYFRKHLETIGDLGSQAIIEIGQVISAFGAPFFKEKAFGLVDICGFTRLSYPEQLSQLYGVANLARQATARVRTFCDRLNVPASFGRASTGDGFYFWNSRVGGHADVAAFMLLLCIMDRAEWMREAEGFPMRLRAAFVIDNVFLLYDTQGDIDETPEADNAVGAATNAAARLIDASKPSQILVGDFSRSGQTEKDEMTPRTLIAQASELFRVERHGAGTLQFSPEERLKTVDRHGVGWYCWNLCGEIPGSRDRGAVTQRIGLAIDSARDISDLSFRFQ